MGAGYVLSKVVSHAAQRNVNVAWRHKLCQDFLILLYRL